MKRYCSLLLLAVLPLLALRCHRDDPEPTLPPATQEGKNTMGCYVNGRPWVAIDKPNSMTSATKVSVGGGGFSFITHRDTPQEQTAVIVGICYGFTGAGMYNLYFPPDSCSEVFYRDYISGKAYLAIDSSRSSLTVTRYDPQARVVAGRFEFTGVAAPGDTVRLTDGRFDFRL